MTVLMRGWNIGLAKRVFLVLATFTFILILYMFYDLGVTRRGQRSSWAQVNSLKREIITCLEHGKGKHCHPEYLSVSFSL